MATVPTISDLALRPALEAIRKDLLDFGMRNPLLNYRLLKARGLRSVKTDAESLFSAIVSEGQEFSFNSAQTILLAE